MRTVLLVCTGNICRSPIAEGFSRSLLAMRGVEEIAVESAGTSAWEGSQAVPEAIEALRELGVDISQHRARRLNRALIERSDLVVAMAAEHRNTVGRLSPNAATRTFTLKEMVDLLRQIEPIFIRGDPEERLDAAVREAAALRASGVAGPSDEDVEDPLGGGLPSFRATAWEIEVLCEELVDLMIGVEPARRQAAMRIAEEDEGR
jgi:protein-tyrosine phosphatase